MCTGFAGSLRRRSSWARWDSEAVRACRLREVLEDDGVGAGEEVPGFGEDIFGRLWSEGNFELEANRDAQAARSHVSTSKPPRSHPKLVQFLLVHIHIMRKEISDIEYGQAIPLKDG